MAEPEHDDDERIREARPARRRDPDREDDELEDEERYRRMRRKVRRDDDDDGGVSTIIPYKNGKALAAYYCGVFALIPCAGNILGPIALFLGIGGLRYVKAHPTAKGTGHAIAGIVLGILTILGYWLLPLVFLAIGIIGAKK